MSIHETGPDGDRRITGIDQAALVVPRDPGDRAHVRNARVRAEAIPSGQTGVRRLDPSVAAIEREIDAGDAYAIIRFAYSSLGHKVGWARLLIDLVIGPRDEHVGVMRINRDHRLVLMISRCPIDGTADAYQAVGRPVPGACWDYPSNTQHTGKNRDHCGQLRLHSALPGGSGEWRDPHHVHVLRHARSPLCR